MSRRLKTVVVHVVGQLDVGGMESLVVEFARHVDRDRFDLHFVTLENRGVAAEAIEALGWQVTDVAAPTGVNPWVAVRLAQVFRRLRADVVHTHNTRALLYAAPTARLVGVPRVIHTCHGQRIAATRRQLMAFRLATRAADRVVCVSHHTARAVQAEGVAARRILSLWNGIDLSRFRLAAPELAAPVLAVGRLSPEKDFETLVRAAALASRQEPGFRLELAGDGGSAPALRRLVDELGLGQAVRMLGQVRDVPTLLSRGSIFALSSLTEGLSIAILEAMASGLPVVATRVGGNPEVVSEGVTGILVPSGDPAALAGALLDLWRDPPKRRAMGAAGRERAEKYFAINSMVTNYENVYVSPASSALPSAPVELVS